MPGRVAHSPADRGYLRLCFVAGTLGRGGAERQLVYMLEALRGHAVEPRVLCLTQGEPYQREIESLEVPVEWIGANPSRLARMVAIIRSLEREPAEVVQSAHFYTNLYASVAGRLTGARSIGAVRNDLLSELRDDRTVGIAHLLLPSYLVANSRLAQQRAVALGRSSARVFLIRNAVDTSHFCLRESRSAVPAPDCLRLLFVGRLTGQKRADRFLRLVERLSREFSDRCVEARLVGDGADRTILENLRSTLRLDPRRVQFVGELADTSALFSWADVLVLPSDHEGTPNVILEAMAIGLPVVATAVGGVTDLLCHGGGLMVRPGSDEAIYAAVKKLMTDARLADCLVQEGARYVARNHSLDGLASQLDTLYETVMEQRTPRQAKS